MVARAVVGNIDVGMGEGLSNMTGMQTRAERLELILTEAFAPVALRVEDDSAHHAGHSGAREGGQTHYNVVVVSAAFRGQSRVARARAVHAALAEEFGPAQGGGMHALSLTLRTPEEYGGAGAI
jgi:BolA protein